MLVLQAKNVFLKNAFQKCCLPIRQPYMCSPMKSSMFSQIYNLCIPQTLISHLFTNLKSVLYSSQTQFPKIPHPCVPQSPTRVSPIPIPGFPQSPTLVYPIPNLGYPNPRPMYAIFPKTNPLCCIKPHPHIFLIVTPIPISCVPRPQYIWVLPVPNHT